MSNKSNSSRNGEKEHCFLGSHTQLAAGTFRCDGTEVTVFENFSDNHYKLSIQLDAFSLGDPDCKVFVILTQKNGKRTERQIPPFLNKFDEVIFSVQDEDIKSVAIRADGNPANSVDIGTTIKTSFCICC